MDALYHLKAEICPSGPEATVALLETDTHSWDDGMDGGEGDGSQTASRSSLEMMIPSLMLKRETSALLKQIYDTDAVERIRTSQAEDYLPQISEEFDTSAMAELGAEDSEEAEDVHDLDLSPTIFDPYDITRRPHGWEKLRSERIKALECQDREESVTEYEILLIRPRREVLEENKMLASEKTGEARPFTLQRTPNLAKVNNL